MTNNCEFCDRSINKQEVFRTDYMKILCPHRPVIDKHLMIMPINHIETFDQLSEDEVLDCFSVIKQIKESFGGVYGMIGYNLMVNNGKKAGQKIPHLHIHFFPRFEGEMISPFKAMSDQNNKVILSEQELDDKVESLKKVFKL